jgi:predicted nucleic acid-binding protein
MGINWKKLIHQKKKVALDTSPFIYLWAQDSTYQPAIAELFLHLESHSCLITVSAIVLTELLVKHYERKDVKQIQNILTYCNLPFVEVNPVTSRIAISAAFLRAKYRFKTPDSLHIASALESRAEVFICNDKALKKVEEIPVLCLDDVIR